MSYTERKQVDSDFAPRMTMRRLSPQDPTGNAPSKLFIGVAKNPNRHTTATKTISRPTIAEKLHSDTCRQFLHGRLVYRLCQNVLLMDDSTVSMRLACDRNVFPAFFQPQDSREHILQSHYLIASRDIRSSTVCTRCRRNNGRL